MAKCGCTTVAGCACGNVSSLRGKSAYEVWVDQQPAGADTSLEAFMAYMKGGQGDPGPAGEDGLDGADGVGIDSVTIDVVPFSEPLP